MSHQPARIGAGIPSGGQFAAGRRAESDVTLDPDQAAASSLNAPADHPVHQQCRLVLTNTPRGRAAALAALPELRASGDEETADRVELAILAHNIRRQHPAATHIVRTIAADSHSVSVVEGSSPGSVASGWHHPQQQAAGGGGAGDLDRLAQITGHPGSVLEAMQRTDAVSGRTVISLDEMSLLAADLPADEQAAESDLEWIAEDLGLTQDARRRAPLVARRIELRRWLAFQQPAGTPAAAPETGAVRNR
ncbi:MAG: hypothetical protein WKF57_03900 [Nakamurella sp.]